MIDAPTVRRRLRRLDQRLQQLRELGERPREAFLKDPIVQAAAERLLQVAIQIVLDVGAHVLTDRGVVDWEEYRAVPEKLAEEGVLAPELAERLARAAGQRNVLVHLYAEVDPDRVYETLEQDLDAFVAFAEAVHRLLEEESEAS